jgi:hypothetical protein
MLGPESKETLTGKTRTSQAKLCRSPGEQPNESEKQMSGAAPLQGARN